MRLRVILGICFLWSIFSLNGQNVLPLSFDSISVNPSSQQIILGWQKSPSPDIIGSIIYKMQDGVLYPLDTILDPEQCFYIDSLADIKKEVEYRICAFNKDFIKSPYLQKRHILTSRFKVENCLDSIHVSWSSVLDMLDNISEFRIYHAPENGNFTCIAKNISPSISQISIPFPLQNGTHHFFLQALNTQAYTSSAAIDTIFIERASLPDTFSIHSLQSLKNGAIRFSIFVSPSDPFQYLSIYRAENAESFSFVENISAIPGKSSYLFTDISVDANKSEYAYYVSLTDTCYRERMQSNTLNSILLQLEALDAQNLRFYWNASFYEQEGSGFYEIYQEDTRDGNTIQKKIIELPFQGNDLYSHLEYFNEEGDFFAYHYYVFAFSKMTSDSAISNYAKVENFDKKLFYMPNAFKIKGSTPTYMPIGKFYPSDQIRFRIYNRWGELIFETDQIAQGWDGTYKGEYVKANVYIYQIEFTRNGISSKKNGYVTLVE